MSCCRAETPSVQMLPLAPYLPPPHHASHHPGLGGQVQLQLNLTNAPACEKKIPTAAGNDDIRDWLLEAFERQQAILHKLIIQQNTSLQKRFGEKVDLVGASLQSGIAQLTDDVNEVPKRFDEQIARLTCASFADSPPQTHTTRVDERTPTYSRRSAHQSIVPEAKSLVSDPVEAMANDLSCDSAGEALDEQERDALEREAFKDEENASADKAASRIIPPLKSGKSNQSIGSLPPTFAEVRREGIGASIRFIVQSRSFDMTMSLIIVMNMFSMFIQLQWEGYEASIALGIRTADDGWPGAKYAFVIFEDLYNVIYLVELALRLWIFRLQYFLDATNTLDAVVVAATSFDAYILRPAGVGNEKGGISVGGVVKVFRVMRILRVFRLLTAFPDLRILMRAVAESASAFFWSMLLLFTIITAAGILMAQLSIGFIYDESLSYDTRIWLVEFYGSAAKATYTMFESTFSGGWINRARPMIDDVNVAFAFVWILYIITVTFAMIRVIAALFLKQTMQAASSDNDKVKMVKLKTQEKFADNLRAFFSEADSSGDGLLSADEFEEMLGNSNMTDMLQQLDLEIYEVTGLFNLLQDDDGEVSTEDFVAGAMRLRTNVRAIDTIMLQTEQTKIKREIMQVAEGIKALDSSLGAKTNWVFKPTTSPTLADTLARGRMSSSTGDDTMAIAACA